VEKSARRRGAKISLVIATSPRTRRLVSSETIADKIALPAEGPSLGAAPAGTCRCRSLLSRKSTGIPSSAACARTYESAACADSFITAPSCPVKTSCPLPVMRVTSMNRMSPPVGVQASPIATPGCSVRSATSLKILAGPR
jgi:hypothetical protein